MGEEVVLSPGVSWVPEPPSTGGRGHSTLSPNHPQLIFNGTAVVNVNQQKHLDLTLQPGLSVEKHLKVTRESRDDIFYLPRFSYL